MNDSDALVAASSALLRTLLHANVKFLRYLTLDVGGNVRCKVVPTAFLAHHPQTLLDGVAFVTASIGGMPSHADLVLEDSGLTAAGTVRLRPDLHTLRILPYALDSAIVLGSLVHDADPNKTSDLCCRTFLHSIVDGILKEHQMIVTVGVELEFVLYEAASFQAVDRSNFADVTLLNGKQDFISAVYTALSHQDISIELLHAESAFGQMEVVLEYATDPVLLADRTVLARMTIQAVANQHGMKAVFLPKPCASQAGNGCHLHLSLRHSETGRNAIAAESPNQIADSSDSGLSPVGESFLEGILLHLPSIMAIAMPTSNSFCRVGKGCWTGSRSVWAIDDKEAPLRVIHDYTNNNSSNNNTRVEFKLCDSSSNIYLAMAAILIAGFEGIRKSAILRAPKSTDTDGSALPHTIQDSLNCLESNELLNRTLPERMLKSHLAIRRAEAQKTSSSTPIVEARDAWFRA